MARDIILGESIYIPFRDGRSINDTQNRARMYRTPEAFQRKFPEYEREGEVVLLEYRPVVQGRWEPRKDVPGFVRCSVCHDCNIYDDWADEKKWNYCPNCGADMREVSDA